MAEGKQKQYIVDAFGDGADRIVDQIATLERELAEAKERVTDGKEFVKRLKANKNICSRCCGSGVIVYDVPNVVDGGTVPMGSAECHGCSGTGLSAKSQAECEELRRTLSARDNHAEHVSKWKARAEAAVKVLRDSHYCEVLERGKGPCNVCDWLALRAYEEQSDAD